MQPDNLNVFDFDGTLIKANSFKEVNKQLIFILFRKFKYGPLFDLIARYFARKLQIISHLNFKRYAVNVFEENLTEKEKKEIVQFVLERNINPEVFDLMFNAENCIISTAAPYAFISRMSFGKEIAVIGSLCSGNHFPDPANFGEGKVENIMTYFSGKSVRIVNFYTDCRDDQPMIDISINAYIVKNRTLIKIK